MGMGRTLLQGCLVAVFAALVLNYMIPLHWFESELEEDEVVVLFNTVSRIPEAKGGAVVLPVHGWVFETRGYASRWLLRFAEWSVLPPHCRDSEDSPEATTPEAKAEAAAQVEECAKQLERFKERATMFLVDNQRGKRLKVGICNSTHTLSSLSLPNGHVQAEVRINETEFARCFAELRRQREEEQGRAGSDYWLPVEVIEAVDADNRTDTLRGMEHVDGFVQLVPDTGVSVLSDIDDTIKVSNVTHRAELFRNAFTRVHAEATGMSILYQRWEKEGAVFHYVSASPWQLHTTLNHFLSAFKFPKGSLHLRLFRVHDRSIFAFLSPPRAFKLRTVRELVEMFPQRRFILVGDTSEIDPEIYAELAASFPRSIVGVFIRNAGDWQTNLERMRRVFKGHPDTFWHLFSDPTSLPSISTIVANSLQ